MVSASSPKPSRASQSLLSALLTATVMFASLPAWAQAADPWQFHGAAHRYLPDVSGRTAFPMPDGSGDAVVDASTIVDNPKMAFPGSFEASQGSRGLFTDVLCMDTGNTKTGFRDISIGGLHIPPGASARADHDLKGWGRTLAGSWHPVTNPAATIDVVAGAGESKLTWQAVSEVGYSFRWGDVVGNWRYLDFQLKSGRAIESLTFNGPSSSAVFRWWSPCGVRACRYGDHP